MVSAAEVTVDVEGVTENDKIARAPEDVIGAIPRRE
jgi:hypothetical protein